MDRRLFFGKKLHSLYAPFYEALCAELPPEWQPYSGSRDFMAQSRLYAQGRTAPGLIVTKATAGRSPHNYGCASDWTLWENHLPIWLKRDDPRWQEYIQAVKKVGLKAGADFGDVDHNELALTCSWTDVFACYKLDPIHGAESKIARSLVAPFKEIENGLVN